jgi:ubiquinone/menaquinone biosynthesis C-methylase UbiE
MNNVETIADPIPRSSKPKLVERLAKVKERWPDFYDCIDLARVSESNCDVIVAMATRAFDFDSTVRGGRGESYRLAQINPMIRSTGIRQLFKFISPSDGQKKFTPQHKVLDVLGGDGVLARAVNQMLPKSSRPHIITSDLSEDMVRAAQAYGLFAIQQPAQRLLLKDNSVDGVIIAYGTHHIAPDQRMQACREAFRVLKPGGRIAFHDFDADSPVSRWFGEVVDRYSQTGHRFAHFTEGEVRQYLQGAGFDDINVSQIYDPFILSDKTEEGAQTLLHKHLLEMYGLVKLVEYYGHARALEMVDDLAHQYFRYDYQRMGLGESFGAPHIKSYQKDGRWFVESPRVALVGHGVKPDDGSSQTLR